MLNLFILVNLIVLLPLVIFGVIISFIKKKVSNNLHTKSKWWIYTLCGFIGTPIHELSHLICHIVFFHKITEVSLYRPIKSKKDGVLGLVSFTYKEKSLYQNIGLFFSGIAPMIGGSIVLFFLMKFILPEVFYNFEFFEITKLNLKEIILSLKNNILNNFNELVTNYSSIERLIIFCVLAFSISTHMSISPADLSNAIKGGVILEIILLICSILLEYYGLNKFTFVVQIISSYLISFLIIGLMFSFMSLVISYLISLIPE